jgi:hypothetical protein
VNPTLAMYIHCSCFWCWVAVFLWWMLPSLPKRAVEYQPVLRVYNWLYG